MPRRKEHSEFTAKVGTRFRELRTKQHLSLAAVSDATSISKGHLSSIEHGLSAITVETVERMANGLGLPPMYLLAFPEEDERARIADLLAGWSDRDLKLLRIELTERMKTSATEGTKAPRSRRRKQG